MDALIKHTAPEIRSKSPSASSFQSNRSMVQKCNKWCNFFCFSPPTVSELKPKFSAA